MPRFAVLGSTGTVGETIANQLVSAGHNVLLVGRNEERLSSQARELEQTYRTVDFSSSQALITALTEDVSTHGALEGIVNCIGSLILKPAHQTSDEEFRQTIETNLFTSFAVVRTAGRLLRESGGSVVLFASAAAEIGIPNHEAIAAAKAGIIGLARSAAATYAQQNIRFNVVSPGLTKTQLTKRIWENPASFNASCEMHALGRLGEASEVAELAVWLLSSECKWLTGQCISVDGGLSSLVARRKTQA